MVGLGFTSLDCKKRADWGVAGQHFYLISASMLNRHMPRVRQSQGRQADREARESQGGVLGLFRLLLTRSGAWRYCVEKDSQLSHAFLSKSLVDHSWFVFLTSVFLALPPTFQDYHAKELTTSSTQERFAWPGTDLKFGQGLEAISVGVDSTLAPKPSWAHVVQRSSCSDCYSCQFVPVFTDHRLHHALMVTVLAGRHEFELCLEVRMKVPVIRSVISGSIRAWEQPCCVIPNA